MSTGRTNQRRGKRFEVECVKRANLIAPSLIVQRVEKDRHVKEPDLEFFDFPHFKVDCKSTISEFSSSTKKMLYKKTKMRYCSDGGRPILILGERKGKRCLNWNEVKVYYRDSRTRLYVEVLYDDWLRYLEKRSR